MRKNATRRQRNAKRNVIQKQKSVKRSAVKMPRIERGVTQSASATFALGPIASVKMSLVRATETTARSAMEKVVSVKKENVSVLV